MKLIQKMQAFVLTALLASGAFFFTGCSKDPIVPKSEQEVLFDYLTSELGNKKWFIKAIYVNGVLQPLTDAQKKYYKTYTRTQSAFTATFLDDDGNRGNAYLLSVIQIKEVVNNGPLGALTRDYVIRELKEKSLDMEITNPPGYPSQIVREVYYAN
ncbi:hypothetical protein [Sediminibacterium sp.]|uniref:hypothetical protein n=1 Tax=Sediminibacterium sp. TaxID=1917865 RepID=UPI0025CFA07E|nr:hypothetical protein [Sediminibacterium sp.]MBW0176347.1 hypothetical protein [Sediminibacterium sp.]